MTELTAMLAPDDPLSGQEQRLLDDLRRQGAKADHIVDAVVLAQVSTLLRHMSQGTDKTQAGDEVQAA